jgi:uncharacterized protein (TIGR03435 family)
MEGNGEKSMVRASVCLLAIAPLVSFAQAPLAFEVASIKPAAPMQMMPGGGGAFRISMGGDPGRINYSGATLKMLIERAWSLKPYQVSGPDWLSAERFDVVAKIPDGAKQTDVPRMLQTLLEERFKIRIHREQKTLPVYALVVGKSGPKLKKTEDASGGMNMMMNMKGRQVSGKTTMDGLVGMLSRSLDRPVLDHTELKDTYDISLQWTPDDRESGPMSGLRAMVGGGGDHPPADNSEGGSAPSLFAALQEQLGLRLESTKGPVEIVVVDSIEKTPIEN